jgi:hypothetical protein
MARPEKTVTKDDRAKVLKLAGYGLSQDQIAQVMEMDRNTLAKHFASELERGKSVAIAYVVDALFSNIKKRDPASIFFYLKTQAGWREKEHVTEAQVTHINFYDDVTQVRQAE